MRNQNSLDSQDWEVRGWVMTSGLTIAEACKVLRVSRRTLYTYMESGWLPYYQAAGNGHRRVRSEDLSKLMIPVMSSNESSPKEGSEETVREMVLQELHALSVPSERDLREHQERDRELEQLRSMAVWAGHPCALCGSALRGVVEPEVARGLLKDLAHKECLEREQSSPFHFAFPFMERTMYEAE